MPTDTNRNLPAPLLTLGEVAERLELARLYKDPQRFLSRRIAAGKIPAYKIGRNVLIAEADIQALIEPSAAIEVTAPDPAPVPMPVGMPSSASLRRRRVA